MGLLAVVGAAACSKGPEGIPDPASVDLSGVERLASLDCASLKLDHSDLLKAAKPTDARPMLDRLLAYDPPDVVARSLQFQADHAGDTMARGGDEGSRAYQITVRWKDAACPVAAASPP